MKTRIVYPRLWYDEKFAATSKNAKLLFMYLITNNQLTLTRYLHITNRQMMFDTGMTSVELEEAKKDLSTIGWVFFFENWVYHNHLAAYVDYSGNERVSSSRASELKSIPPEVVTYFDKLVKSESYPQNR